MMSIGNVLNGFRIECQRCLRRLQGDEGGATAVITAICLTMLIGFVGLGTEVGMWYQERRAMQTAADAAALGAGFDMFKNGKNSSTTVAAGEADATRNGFTNGVNNVTVTINKPPTQGAYAGKDTAVEVILTKERATLFSSLFTAKSVNIEVRSVATTKKVGVYCILALAEHEPAALLFTGTANVLLKNCGINVNSDDSSGALTSKGASVVGATYADIVGGLSQSNNSELNVGTITTGADAIDDPYENLNVPAGSGCDYTNFTVGSSESKSLTPGRYCGGILIQGTAYFSAGNYVIVGGTLDIRAGAVVTSDTVNGVTIFLTGSGTDYAMVNINGGAQVNLVASTAGDYKGIAVFQDRNAPVKNTGSPNTFNGGSNLSITGAVYIPKQLVVYNGGNTTNGSCTRVVAYMITFSGNAGLNTDCGYGFGVSQSFPPVLAE
ncbi:MAG TPA: pilus assembly protein TadG-related protein [Dongiaceae bacterium]|nr:pilus assembly protein TadG-related protein [Dongiaceae bacterium]